MISPVILMLPVDLKNFQMHFQKRNFEVCVNNDDECRGLNPFLLF